MNYMLSERAARALRRLLHDANAVVAADHVAPRKIRPDVPPAKSSDHGAFKIGYSDDGHMQIQNCVFMFGRTGAPINVGTKDVDEEGIYTIRINNFTPSGATWQVYSSLQSSTEFITYLPIVKFEQQSDGSLLLTDDYRRMPFVPTYDRET